MLRQPPSLEDLTPTRDAAAGWERVAMAMREEDHQLDDMARARLERNLVEAWRARSARSVALPTSSARKRSTKYPSSWSNWSLRRSRR